MSNRVMQLFSLYDRTADLFGVLFLAENPAIAIRAFHDSILKPSTSSDIANHPDDFELYLVGEWDHSTGSLIPQPLGKPLIS